MAEMAAARRDPSQVPREHGHEGEILRRQRGPHRRLLHRDGQVLRQRRPAVRHGQRRLVVRRGPRVRRVHAPDHRKAAGPARDGADHRHRHAHRRRQRSGFRPGLRAAAADAGQRGDMALGISTSGKSANVNRALQAAREMGMLTVGFSGRDGGRMPEYLRLLLHRAELQHPPHSGNARDAAARCLGLDPCDPRRGGRDLA